MTVREVADDRGCTQRTTDRKLNQFADRGEPPTVIADESQLEQILQHLISNASKYRREEPRRIEIGVDLRDDEWRFRVADIGIGIDPVRAGRIFEVSNRLHTTEGYPGTGIGPSMCQKIVERHGGRIWVESEPRCGSTFFTISMEDHENKKPRME